MTKKYLRLTFDVPLNENNLVSTAIAQYCRDLIDRAYKGTEIIKMEVLTDE